MRRVLVLMLLIAACHSSKPFSPILAAINGEEVTVAQFQNYWAQERWKFGDQALDAERMTAVREKVFNTFVEEYLLLKEAQQRNLQAVPEEVAEAVREFREIYPDEESFTNLLKKRGWTVESFQEQRKKELLIRKLTGEVTREKAPWTKADLRKYYEKNRKEFFRPEQVRARQIVTDSMEKANEISQLIANGLAFAEAAQKYSLSPDRKKGGDLGWFGHGVMPPEFEAVCFSLKPGEISQVVATPYGFHLFEVLEHRPALALSFEEVAPEIEKKMMEGEGRKVFREWFAALQAKAEIKMSKAILEGIR